jgi:pyridoxine kinase
MGRILAISSQVARGHVGLSAGVPALQALGHEVWALPTILLSNHPGHPHVAGTRIEPAVLERMVDALEQNGWLADVDAVLSGYLPTPDHVHFVGRVVRRLKARTRPLYVCDPVLGDEPKGVYLDVHAATAVRHELLPLADVTTPNRFELGWLAGAPVDSIAAVVAAARHLGPADVYVTSADLQGGRLLNLHVTADHVLGCGVTALATAPHGTGDLYAALLLGHLLHGADHAHAMGRAAAGVAVALDRSHGRDELDLAGHIAAVAHAAPATIAPP